MRKKELQVPVRPRLCFFGSSSIFTYRFRFLSRQFFSNSSFAVPSGENSWPHLTSRWQTEPEPVSHNVYLILCALTDIFGAGR